MLLALCCCCCFRLLFLLKSTQKTRFNLSNLITKQHTSRYLHMKTDNNTRCNAFCFQIVFLLLFFCQIKSDSINVASSDSVHDEDTVFDLC